MRSDFYYWLTTVVIVTVLFGLFIEFLWTTAKVPDIVCRIPDITGYPKYCRIIRHCRISGTSLMATVTYYGNYLFVIEQ
jgi:hypothetical protein